MALQALALYSEKTAGNAVDLKVKLTFGDVGPIAVHITPENALLRKKIKVRIHFTTSGFSSTLYMYLNYNFLKCVYFIGRLIRHPLEITFMLKVVELGLDCYR